MSRIEEALARARNQVGEPLTIPTAVPGEVQAEFPAEPGVQDSPLAAAEIHPAPAPAPAVVAIQPESQTLDTDGPISTLPHAEKMMLHAMDSTPVEQYRRLAARLLMAQAEKGTRIVMVTSAYAGEGKTLTATNLALTLGESYKRSVLLVDADLRRPWIHEMFQVPNASGLNDGLRDPGDRKIPLLHYTENLSILTAGRPDPDPMSVLSGERMRRVIAEAGTRFDFVVIDTPPVALLTDAHLLSSLVDTVLLVVQSGQTPLAAIKTAVQSVGRERILGVVLNRADEALPSRLYGYYSGYRSANYAAR
jgi:capsular exopolysaccharide synthesis family protein